MESTTAKGGWLRSYSYGEGASICSKAEAVNQLNVKNQEKVNTCNADVTHCFDTMLEPNKSAYQNEFFHLGLTICTLVSEASSLHVSQLY